MTGLTGTRTLIRLALRRDRIALPLWVVVLCAAPAGTVPAYEQLYPDAASRASLNGSTASNPSIALIYGPAYDLTTAGGFTAWRYGSFLALFIALMAVFTVTRHTRAEEDSGRLELLGSTVLGRYAPLTAAVAVAGGTSLVIGVLTSLGLVGAGLSATGSFTLGLGIAGTGLVFTAIAAVTAQVTEYSRSANGLAMGVLGLTFLLRAVGDSTPSVSWLSWLSPLAWPQLARPFVTNQGWVFPLAVVVAVGIGVVAYLLVPRRDLGAGLLPARLGPAAAPASLSGALGLAWRLHRGSLIGWAVGMALIGAVFGSLADGIAGLVGDSDQVREIFSRMGGAQGIVDAYLAAIAGLFGMLAAVHAVQAALRMRVEETANRAEPVLATGVRRTSWMGSHLVFSLLGSALLLVVAGSAAGLAHGLRVDDTGTQVANALVGALAQLPAVWSIAGVAALLFGALPGISAPISWAVMGVSLALALFGPAIGLSQVLLNLSPFSHVPKLPGAPATATPFIWLTGLAVLALGAGLATFRRRDIG